LFTTPSCDRDGALFNDSLSGCFVLFPINTTFQSLSI
jgi:hypothetical protein